MKTNHGINRSSLIPGTIRPLSNCYRGNPRASDAASHFHASVFAASKISIEFYCLYEENGQEEEKAGV